MVITVFLDYIYLIVKKSSCIMIKKIFKFWNWITLLFIWWVICGPPSLSKRVISTDVDVFFGDIGNACIQCTCMLVFIHWSIWCGIKSSYKSKIRCRIPCTQDVIIHSCRAHAIHIILIDETYVRKDILSRFKGKKRRSTNWILDSCNGNLYTTYRKGASTKKKIIFKDGRRGLSTYQSWLCSYNYLPGFCVLKKCDIGKLN